RMMARSRLDPDYRHNLSQSLAEPVPDPSASTLLDRARYSNVSPAADARPARAGLPQKNARTGMSHGPLATLGSPCLAVERPGTIATGASTAINSSRSCRRRGGGQLTSVAAKAGSRDT